MRIKDLVQGIAQPSTQKAQEASPTSGLVLPGCLDGARGVMNDVVDAFDNAVGLDSPGAKPLTFAARDSDFATMESKVAQMGGSGAPTLDDDTRTRLDAGRIVANYAPMENGLAMFHAMRAAKPPCELHVFQQGGHGFGIRLAKGKPCSEWPDLFLHWGWAGGWFRGQGAAI